MGRVQEDLLCCLPGKGGEKNDDDEVIKNRSIAQEYSERWSYTLPPTLGGHTEVTTPSYWIDSLAAGKTRLVSGSDSTISASESTFEDHSVPPREQYLPL